MKIKSAHIENFKLLRAVQLSFSTDPHKPLTVIRAENGSGKTSTLYAIQWSLFGEAGLDESARAVRLTPSDWPQDSPCEIKVEIEFAHRTFNEMNGEFVPSDTDYRLIRSVTETPRECDRFERSAELIRLYEMTDSGSELVGGPEIRIQEMLPIEMRDVFITDGDRAMNFISPSLDRDTKRHQVREAIRSLLGLDTLESALGHVRKAKDRFTKALAKSTGNREAEEVQERMEKLSGEKERLEHSIRDLDNQIDNLSVRENEADRKLLQAMKGIAEHAEIARRVETLKVQLVQVGETEQGLKQTHQKLLGSEDLSWHLIGPALNKGAEALGALADKGIIPATSVPVLQDRISLGICICGTDLKEGTSALKHVRELIETQRSIDEEKELLTALHHRARLALQASRQKIESGQDWPSSFSELARRRSGLKKTIKSIRDDLRVQESKIEGIDEQQVEDLRKVRDAVQADKSRKMAERNKAKIDLTNCIDQLVQAEEKWRKIEKANKKASLIQQQLTVSRDLESVIEGTLTELNEIYLARVSARMNEMFLQMVGVDPEAAGGVFKEARITDEHEIEVLTADDRTLNPDHELNGASKRALTLAFIWALTEVSQVSAPRLIDTPLGMMSGGVKRRVVEIITDACVQKVGGKPATAAEFQVILFLTRQEITKIEALIDDRAGCVYTYTNTASYPIDLAEDPGTEHPEIRVCNCSHRQSCSACARKDDDEFGLTRRATSSSAT